jgi:hypothetical protein
MVKTLVCLFAVLVAACSFAVEVTALPTSEYADAEISTNFVFAVGEGGGRRLVFSIELEATPTNNGEVAIGHDADGDGRLSLDETALAVGYDCGEWFVRSAAKDSVTCEAVPSSGAFRRTYEIRSRNVDPSWNLVKVTRRGLGVSSESISLNLVEFGFGLTVH